MSDFMHNYLAKQTLSIGNHIWPNVCPFYLPSLLLCDNIYIGHELILFLCAGPIVIKFCTIKWYNIFKSLSDL